MQLQAAATIVIIISGNAESDLLLQSFNRYSTQPVRHNAPTSLRRSPDISTAGYVFSKWLVVEISWIFFWAVSVATSSGIIYAALGFHGCLLRWIMQVHHSRMTGLIYSNGPDCKLKSWKRIGELYQIDCGFEACWFNITSFFLVSGHYGAWIAVRWCQRASKWCMFSTECWNSCFLAS